MSDKKGPDEAYDLNSPFMKDMLGEWRYGEMNPENSSMRGRVFTYIPDQKNYEAGRQKFMEMEHLNMIRQYQIDLSLHKEAHNRFPASTRRVAGRVAPGEAERQLRKKRFRSATRSQAEMLCKFMLFKKGKFMPGKMV